VDKPIKYLRSTNHPNLIRSITCHKKPPFRIKSYIHRTETFRRAIQIVAIAHDIDGGFDGRRGLGWHTSVRIHVDFAESVAVGWIPVPVDPRSVTPCDTVHEAIVAQMGCKGLQYVPGAMEGNICRGAITVETDAQRRRVAREAQLRCHTLCAYRITACADRKLHADLDVSVVGYYGWIPCCKAVWVAVIGATFERHAVEGTVVVELF
jgi:hypothetical protein